MVGDRREGGRESNESPRRSRGRGPERRRSYLVLTTNIPHGERNVLVLDGLDVETCGSARGRRRRKRCESLTSSAPERLGTPPCFQHPHELGNCRIAAAKRRARARSLLKGLTDGRNGGNDLAELELVEDGGLTGGVETNLLGRSEKGAGFNVSATPRKGNTSHSAAQASASDPAA